MPEPRVFTFGQDLIPPDVDAVYDNDGDIRWRIGRHWGGIGVEDVSEAWMLLNHGPVTEATDFIIDYTQAGTG